MKQQTALHYLVELCMKKATFAETDEQTESQKLERVIEEKPVVVAF